MANLLDAALVSAVVAFRGEWLAKPRLEARKERILRRYRARDELRRLLDGILFDATKLRRQTLATNADNGEVRQAADAIVVAAQSLEEVFRSELMLLTSERRTGLLASYVGFVRGVTASAGTAREKGEQVVTGTSMLIDVVGGPFQGPLCPVRWRYCARQMAELTKLLDAPDRAALLPAISSRESRVGDVRYG